MEHKHDPKTEEFLHKLSALKLSEEKRSAIWRELEAVREFHPARDDVRATAPGRSTTATSGATWWASIRELKYTYSRTMKASLLIALLVAAGGGTAFAAQNALPGDPLYGMKLHVNEEVRSALTFGTNAEAELQAELLRERVREAAELEAEGRLTGETEREISARIAAQTDTATRLAAESEAGAGAKLNADISSTLAFLSSLKGSLDPRVATRATLEGEVGAGSDGRMEMAVRSEATEESAIMADDSFSTSMIASDLSVSARLEQSFARLENLEVVVENATNLSADVRSELTARLKDARAELTAAETAFRAEGEAAASAQVNATADILGSIESDLSLLGDITIDPQTGFITGITIGGSGSGTISNFEECVAAGNPVMESYPEQCRADGKTFVNEAQLNLEVEGEVDSVSPTSLEADGESSSGINVGI